METVKGKVREDKMNNDEIKLSTRIAWLDSLKGIACLCVFIHHFLLAFYPEVHFGHAVSSMLKVKNLAESPFMFWANGNFCVCLFLLISGFLVSRMLLLAYLFEKYFVRYWNGFVNGILNKKE